MSARDVMLAYYEAHPDETPQSVVKVEHKLKDKKGNSDGLKVKWEFNSKDVALAVGVSFGATFLVIVVLYLLGAVT
jgi:hypothetical protein